MPIDLERTIRRKLAAEQEAKKEAQFGHTLLLVCLMLSLANMVLAIEKPAYAATMICIN